MKRIISFALLFAIMASSLAFTSCKAKIEFEDGYYRCAKNGVTYKIVPFQYSPVAIGKEYAVLIEGETKTKLYEIEGAEPTKWLSTEGGDLFCAVDERVPELAEIEVDSILLCKQQEIIVALADISKPDEIEKIINRFLGNDTVSFLQKDIENTFKLKMTSEKFPWLYFDLTYLEYARDIYEYDYPENIDEYEYRNISEGVKVESLKQFECRYKIDKSMEKKYKAVAYTADVEFFSYTKPDGSLYACLAFDNEKNLENCIDKLVEKCKGEYSEEEIRNMMANPYKAEQVNAVRYNYGKYFIYDRFTNKCVPAGDLIHKYRGGSGEK